MVGLGFYFIALFAAAFFWPRRAGCEPYRALPDGSRCVSLPLPWLAAELGWIVAEDGRQPWTIEGVLPTFLPRLEPDGDQRADRRSSASSPSIRRCWSSRSI